MYRMAYTIYNDIDHIAPLVHYCGLKEDIQPEVYCLDWNYSLFGIGAIEKITWAIMFDAMAQKTFNIYAEVLAIDSNEFAAHVE